MRSIRTALASLAVLASLSGAAHAEHFRHHDNRGHDFRGQRHEHFDGFQGERRGRGERMRLSEIGYEGGSLIREGRHWLELDRRGRANFEFVETGRERGSLYLWDNSRGVELRVDLRDGVIYYRDSGSRRARPLYEIEYWR